MSIHDIYSEIKNGIGYLKSEQFLVSLIVVLAATGAYGLGRISSKNEVKTPIVINCPKAETESYLDKKTRVVGSKNGSKYYFENCSGASRISSANLISWGSEREAEEAGYVLAENCER